MVIISRSRLVSECVSIQDKISLKYILYDSPQSGVIEDLIGRRIHDPTRCKFKEAERQVAIEDRGVGIIVSSVVFVMVRP